jgi:hypothetical protein
MDLVVGVFQARIGIAFAQIRIADRFADVVASMHRNFVDVVVDFPLVKPPAIEIVYSVDFAAGSKAVALFDPVLASVAAVVGSEAVDSIYSRHVLDHLLVVFVVADVSVHYSRFSHDLLSATLVRAQTVRAVAISQHYWLFAHGHFSSATLARALFFLLLAVAGFAFSARYWLFSHAHFSWEILARAGIVVAVAGFAFSTRYSLFSRALWRLTVFCHVLGLAPPDSPADLVVGGGIVGRFVDAAAARIVDDLPVSIPVAFSIVFCAAFVVVLVAVVERTEVVVAALA